MFEREPAFNPESTLWQEVLRASIEDALSGPPETRTWEAFVYECQKARDYLTTPSKDFSLVCTLAGLDAEAVMDRIRKQIANAPSPEELADKAGKRHAKNRQSKKGQSDIGFDTGAITHAGETLTLKQWSEKTGIAYGALYFRLSCGWSIKDALTVPVGGRRCIKTVHPWDQEASLYRVEPCANNRPQSNIRA